MSSAIAAVVVAAVSSYVSYSNAQSAKKQQESAQKQAQQNADKQATMADQEANKASQKRPDTSAILSAAQQAGKAGASGTMLTGPSGVDPSTLALGKSTLLGQ